MNFKYLKDCIIKSLIINVTMVKNHGYIYNCRRFRVIVFSPQGFTVISFSEKLCLISVAFNF